MDESAPDRLDVGLGAAVRRLRRQRGMTQLALAEALGVSFQQVQKYEQGANRISFSTLMRTCGALGCSVGELVADVEGLARHPAEGSTLPLEAPALLDAVSAIGSPGVRRAIVDFARTMARDGAPGLEG